MGGIFPKSVSKKQASDSGMAAVLILMLIALFTGEIIYFKIAIPVLIINMVFPMFFYYFAILWLGLSQILGTIISKILLSVVFFIVVLPMGFLRKLMRKDSMRLKEFKQSDTSVMQVRNHRFTAKDIENPY